MVDSSIFVYLKTFFEIFADVNFQFLEARVPTIGNRKPKSAGAKKKGGVRRFSVCCCCPQR